MKNYRLNYLKKLEAESIYILREVVAEFNNPVMLYSIGKDSSVLLKLAEKAFYPGKIPFPLLHIDTGYKFKEMIEFRDYYIDKIGANLIVSKNMEEIALKMTAFDAHTDTYIYYKKTKPLLEALKIHEFDAAFGGARRDEEKSRAKERIYSFRNKEGVWDPKSQRPELWHLFNSKLNPGETMRVFPLSNWTEEDIWMYIKEEKVEIVPLYYAKKRKVISRNGMYLRIDDYVQVKDGEEIIEMSCRYRTLGCSPSTGVVPSSAIDLDGILKEVIDSQDSERGTRAIDQGSESSMEKKKIEGYF